MIYKIDDKYYINISPMIYSEVKLIIENNDIIVKPLGRKIEVNRYTKVENININDEKQKLLNASSEVNRESSVNDTIQYRPNKYNRRK